MSRNTTAILLSVLGLVIVSACSLYSALMLHPRGQGMLLSQFAALGAGFLGLLVTAVVNYRVWNRMGWIGLVYGVAIGLLVAVLIPGVGTFRNGAQRWLYGFQPSEFAKLALVLSLAWFAARFQHRLSRWPYALAAGAVPLPLLYLIFREPDRGTTLFLAALSGLLLLVAGVRWQYMVALGATGALILGPVLVADPLVRHRIAAFINPQEHKGDGAFQNRQALLAFAEGGWFGKGPGASTMARTVPEGHTDFILSIVGEELGLIGALLVVAMFGVILFTGSGIARRAGESGDMFGLMLACGITFLIALQAFFNIGIVTAIFPNKGLPLPFVSRGGSNVVVMLTMVGFLLSIDRNLPREALATRAGLQGRRSRRRNPFGDETESAASTGTGVVGSKRNPFGGAA